MIENYRKTGRFLRSVSIWALFLSLSACMTGRDQSMGFKQITPALQNEMSSYIKKGCDREYRYFDPEIAQVYSIIPGGAQFYMGETKKGWMYALSSPLIIPYIISFQDAQNSVDYYNFRYTLKYCRDKFKAKSSQASKNKKRKRQRRPSKMPQKSK
jgi:hypothetical protein